MLFSYSTEVVIRLTKPIPKPWHPTGDLETNTETREVSVADVAQGPSTTTVLDPTKKKKLPPTPLAVLSEIKFDLRVARISLLVDFLSHSLVSVASSSSTPLFVGFSLMNSLGTGLVPALHSIAMCTLYLRERNANGVDASAGLEESGKGGKDIGKLFGSLAVLQAVGMSILGVSRKYLLFLSKFVLTGSDHYKAYAIRLSVQHYSQLIPQSYLYFGCGFDKHSNFHALSDTTPTHRSPYSNTS